MRSANFFRFPEKVSYPDALHLQECLVRSRVRDEIPDTFLLLQHPPVITLGRRGRRTHILASEAELHALQIPVYPSGRGGDVTCHGPGQWVLYPILKLGKNEVGVHGYLHALEDIALQTARQFGIQAYRKEGKAGAWCDSGKIAAVGFKFTRWVSSHGLSLNVSPNLQHFDLIVGCGLVGESVSSFEEVLGNPHCPSMKEVGDDIEKRIPRVFDRNVVAGDPHQLLRDALQEQL